MYPDSQIKIKEYRRNITTAIVHTLITDKDNTMTSLLSMFSYSVGSDGSNDICDTK